MGQYTVDNQAFIYDTELVSLNGTYTTAAHSSGANGSWKFVGGYAEKMFAILDISAMAGATGETYNFAIDLAPSASPSSGEILRTIKLTIGAEEILGGLGADLGNGRYQIPFIQMFNKDYDLPYARISISSIAGTSGSVTVKGWFTAR